MKKPIDSEQLRKGLKGKTLLFVYDLEYEHGIVREDFAKAGVDAHLYFAKSVGEAVMAMEAMARTGRKPDLIVTDFMLPTEKQPTGGDLMTRVRNGDYAPIFEGKTWDGKPFDGKAVPFAFDTSGDEAEVYRGRAHTYILGGGRTTPEHCYDMLDAAHALTPDPAIRLHHKRILFVNDQRMEHHLVEQELKKAGVDCFAYFAGSVREAEDMLRTMHSFGEQPDLIVSDYELSSRINSVSGLEFCRRLRSGAYDAYLPERKGATLPFAFDSCGDEVEQMRGKPHTYIFGQRDLITQCSDVVHQEYRPVPKQQIGRSASFYTRTADARDMFADDRTHQDPERGGYVANDAAAVRQWQAFERARSEAGREGGQDADKRKR
ncbi:MAG: response regulator [Rickettsiales bacterium]|nr:response regulator [Rickettsiales bacterium]